MRPPRGTCPESVALALQSVQVLVESGAGSLLTDQHVVWAVVAECDKLRLSLSHIVGSLEALKVRDDRSLSLLVAQMLTNLGAVVDET